MTDAMTAPPPAPDAGRWVSSSSPDIMDFTVHLDIRFKIDNDIFVGRPNISADRLITFAGLMDDMADAPMPDQRDLIRAAFEMLLEPASAEVFKRRIGDDDNPISMDQVNRVQVWLMEQYGMRPTTPAESSSVGLPDPADGTSSTPAGSPAESGSDTSQQPTSST